MVAITGPGTALQELLSGIIMALILVYAALFEITHYSDKESFAFAVIGMCVTWGVIDGVLAYYSWMVNARHQHRVLTNVDNIDRETRLNEIKDSFSGTTLDLLSEKSEMEICNTILDSEIERLTKQRDEKFEALQKCEQTTKGFKIAGIATLAATGVGIYGNIKLSQQIKGQKGKSSSHSGGGLSAKKLTFDESCKSTCDAEDCTSGYTDEACAKACETWIANPEYNLECNS